MVFPNYMTVDTFPLLLVIRLKLGLFTNNFIIVKLSKTLITPRFSDNKILIGRYFNHFPVSYFKGENLKTFKINATITLPNTYRQFLLLQSTLCKTHRGLSIK